MWPVGKKHREDSYARMREAQRKRFDEKPISEESKARMRESALHKPKINEATRKRISLGQIKRRRTEALVCGIAPYEYDQQILSGNRWCSVCLTFQAASEFDEATKRRCKSCQRNSLKATYRKYADIRGVQARRKYAQNENGARERARVSNLRRYGITAEWYDQKVAVQNGLCDICKRSPGKRSLAVDHNHLCCPHKKACERCRRGLLCDRCNLALERAETIPGWFEMVQDYFSRYPLLEMTGSHNGTAPLTNVGRTGTKSLSHPSVEVRQDTLW